ncbi:MAG: hypothetical protein KAQ62_20840 [Cyclobacteriaceae bacterium]|nr:hypothetical protein [Cyclobacteriaceae bacterium]
MAEITSKCRRLYGVVLNQTNISSYLKVVADAVTWRGAKNGEGKGKA